MTPEEKFNREVWYVLQKIKEASFRASPTEFIEYVVRFNGYKPSDAPEPENEIKILEKIDEWGGIQILRKGKHPSAYDIQVMFFYLITLNPTFENLYKKYEQTFNHPANHISHPTATEYVRTLRVLAETPAWLSKIKKERGIEDKKEIQSLANNQILTAADKKKLCVLEKLKEEENLTPKIPVKRHISFGYSYIRPANEANLSEQKLITWIKECGLSDVNELENILSIFQQNGLISKFNFSEQERVLKMQFPENFEKRSSEYKAGILSIQKPAKTETQQQEKNSNDNDKDVIKVQTKAGLLIFNKDTGYAKLEKVEAKENINPQSQETKVLLKLMTGKNHQATYEDLLGENPSKTNKRNLGFVIRNLKEILGILPKKKAQNKNCIKNIKGYGYKLIT